MPINKQNKFWGMNLGFISAEILHKSSNKMKSVAWTFQLVLFSATPKIVWSLGIARLGNSVYSFPGEMSSIKYFISTCDVGHVLLMLEDDLTGLHRVNFVILMKNFIIMS